MIGHSEVLLIHSGIKHGGKNLGRLDTFTEQEAFGFEI